MDSIPLNQEIGLQDLILNYKLLYARNVTGIYF